MSELQQCCCCCCGSKDINVNKNNSYKRAVRNNENWNARNSSVQMSAILSPDNYDEAKTECSCDFIEALPDEVTKTAGKIKWAGGNKKQLTHSRYHQKCFSKKPPKQKIKKPINIKRNIVPSTSCCQCAVDSSKPRFKNECYCCYPPDKPFLPVKPAVTKPNPRRTIRSGFKSLEGEIESNRNLQTLRKAKNLLQDYAPESEFLRRLQKEAKEVYDCQCNACKTKEETAGLKFTRHRHLLEEAYKDIDKNKEYSLDEIGRQSHKCDIKSCNCNRCSKMSPKNSLRNASLSDKMSPKNSQYFTSLSPQISPKTSPNDSPKTSNLIDCDKIHEIKHIRNDNYFETHSTDVNLDPKNIPDHKCVHKFTLDNRLLPKPLNADGFGVSRCTVCNKAMENNSALNEDLVNSVNYETSSKTSLQYHEGKFPMMKQNSPRKINIGNKNNVIELNVPPVLITDRKDFKVNKMAPTNTWALRYQKGVI